MSGRTVRLALVALAVVAQLGVPISMIFKHERTLADGELFRFRTAPVDPIDAFRGRYVALALEQTSVPAPPGVFFERGERAYAPVRAGEDGFAELSGLRAEPPAEGAFLEVRVLRQRVEVPPTPDTVQLWPLFDRYYMPEDLAPRAEIVYRERVAEGETFVAVRVRDGFAVIEDLYVAGQPIRELLAADPDSAD